MTNTEAKQLHQESLSKRPALLKQINDTPERVAVPDKENDAQPKWVTNPIWIALKNDLRNLDRLISVLGQVWNDRISCKAQLALEVL